MPQMPAASYRRLRTTHGSDTYVLLPRMAPSWLPCASSRPPGRRSRACDPLGAFGCPLISDRNDTRCPSDHWRPALPAPHRSPDLLYETYGVSELDLNC